MTDPLVTVLTGIAITVVAAGIIGLLRLAYTNIEAYSRLYRYLIRFCLFWLTINATLVATEWRIIHKLQTGLSVEDVLRNDPWRDLMLVILPVAIMFGIGFWGMLREKISPPEKQGTAARPPRKTEAKLRSKAPKQ